jgi:hypothetical protein
MRIGPITQTFCQNRSVALRSLGFRGETRSLAESRLPRESRLAQRSGVPLCGAGRGGVSASEGIPANRPVRHPAKPCQKPTISVTAAPRQYRSAPARRPAKPRQNLVIFVTVSPCQYSAATPDNIKTRNNNKHCPMCISRPLFHLDDPPKNRYYPQTKRMWRNWQTRRLQEPVGLYPWRFDSSHPQSYYICREGVYSRQRELSASKGLTCIKGICLPQTGFLKRAGLSASGGFVCRRQGFLKRVGLFASGEFKVGGYFRPIR